MNDSPKDASKPSKPSGPVRVKNLTVTVDRDLCIGAATCLAIAPKVFALDDDGKAIVIEGADDTDEESVVNAARACPTAAIKVLSGKNEQLAP